MERCKAIDGLFSRKSNCKARLDSILCQITDFEWLRIPMDFLKQPKLFRLLFCRFDVIGLCQFRIQNVTARTYDCFAHRHFNAANADS